MANDETKATQISYTIINVAELYEEGNQDLHT